MTRSMTSAQCPCSFGRTTGDQPHGLTQDLSLHVILVQLPILRLRDPVEDADEIAEKSPHVARDDYPRNLMQLAKAHVPLAYLRQLPHPGPIKVGGKTKERHWQDCRMSRAVSDRGKRANNIIPPYCMREKQCSKSLST